MDHPVHKYWELVRELGLQILSWRPKNVERRDGWGLACHRLYFALGLPIARYGIATHIFFFHWTGRLRRHGNGVGISTEGGKATHIPHKRIVEGESAYYKNRCPPGIHSTVVWSTRGLALWSIGHLDSQPVCHFDALPTLPAMENTIG